MTLGYAHPDDLLEHLTSHQLSEWIAYLKIRGLPEARAELRSGMLLALLANVYRGDRTKVYRPEDFMPGLKAPEDASSEQHEPSDDDFDRAAPSAAVAKLLGIKDT